MATISPTAATPPPPPTNRPLPPPLPGDAPPIPPPDTGNGEDNKSFRIKINNWLEDRFGRAAMPIAAATGGVIGGGLGMLALGPIGAAIGGAAGAFGGALFFMAG